MREQNREEDKITGTSRIHWWHQSHPRHPTREALLPIKKQKCLRKLKRQRLRRVLYRQLITVTGGRLDNSKWENRG